MSAVGERLLGHVMSSVPLIRFDNLTLGYDRHPAVHHLTGDVSPGSLLAIVGPNGAGKSTLLKGMVGAMVPLQGAVHLGGLKRTDIAYLPQAAEIDRSFPISVFDLVAAGAWRSTGLFGGFGRQQRDAIHEALMAVGLKGFENRTIGALSGGQLQRVLFARLLVQNAKLILLDEPFTAIDGKTAADLLAIVKRWHGEQRTVIAVLHDMDVVRQHFPQTMLLAREVVAWGETSNALSSENLLKARRMSEAHDPRAEPCPRAA
jgi:zinc/manganese transport system ATP-binding protein